jgi:hypothetical protein
MIWIRQKAARLILASTLACPLLLHAQRKDQYLYEKVEEQEKHLDHTDSNVSDTLKVANSNSSRLDRDEGYFAGFMAAVILINALGLLKNFQRKKDQAA